MPAWPQTGQMTGRVDRTWPWRVTPTGRMVAQGPESEYGMGEERLSVWFVLYTLTGSKQ